jgi:hypothetical protein
MVVDRLTVLPGQRPPTPIQRTASYIKRHRLRSPAGLMTNPLKSSISRGALGESAWRSGLRSFCFD